MSERKPTAIEKLPDLESYLGLDEKAADDAQRIKELALTLHGLKRLQLQENLKDSDAIPGRLPTDDGKVPINGQKYRNFTQQREVINKAFVRIWEAVDQEGYRANLERALNASR